MSELYKVINTMLFLTLCTVVCFRQVLGGGGYWRLMPATQYSSSSRSSDYGRYPFRSPPQERSTRPPVVVEPPMQISMPLTLELCRTKRYGNLRTCKMALKNKWSMDNASHRYLCASQDRWGMRGVRRSRTKRRTTKGGSTAVNQCSGTATKRVILQAYEAEPPHRKRELLQDPENFLYQTHFVESCQNYGPFNGFECRMHDVRFKAAVWSLDPSSDDIFVIDVVTEGYCALSQVR